jgi:hypothetical protein
LLTSNEPDTTDFVLRFSTQSRYSIAENDSLEAVVRKPKPDRNQPDHRTGGDSSSSGGIGRRALPPRQNVFDLIPTFPAGIACRRTSSKEPISAL